MTRDFGHQRLARSRVAKVGEGQTIMRLLQSTHRVETRHGGRFVQAIDGLPGRGTTGGPDWFYYVNGILGEVAAGQRQLAPGDVVQWDYRAWKAARRVPAIVGAYPEPFVSGTEGKRLPTRLECETEQGPACEEVTWRLSAAGVPVARARLATPGGQEGLRVVVARWAAARRVRAASRLEGAPDRSGVFARFRSGRLELLDPAGRVARAAPPGSGLVAATATAGERPVWLITGVDEAGVEAAAKLLDERRLRDAFAVAATPRGAVRLPVMDRSLRGGRRRLALR